MKRQLVKFWICGCVSVFTSKHPSIFHPRMGWCVWRCRQCKLAYEILDKIREEERQEKK